MWKPLLLKKTNSRKLSAILKDGIVLPICYLISPPLLLCNENSKCYHKCRLSLKEEGGEEKDRLICIYQTIDFNGFDYLQLCSPLSSFQVVNSTDTTVNVTSVQTNQTITTVPAKKIVDFALTAGGLFRVGAVSLLVLTGTIGYSITYVIPLLSMD